MLQSYPIELRMPEKGAEMPINNLFCPEHQSSVSKPDKNFKLKWIFSQDAVLSVLGPIFDPEWFLKKVKHHS